MQEASGVLHHVGGRYSKDSSGSRGPSFGGDHKFKQKWVAGTSSVHVSSACSEKQPRSMIHTCVPAQRRTGVGAQELQEELYD